MFLMKMSAVSFGLRLKGVRAHKLLAFYFQVGGPSVNPVQLPKSSFLWCKVSAGCLDSELRIYAAKRLNLGVLIFFCTQAFEMTHSFLSLQEGISNIMSMIIASQRLLRLLAPSF